MTLLAGLTEEQEGLRDAVRALLARRCDSAAVRRAVDSPRGYDEALWRSLCEQTDGVGAGETHLVMQELGRRLTPSPMLGSRVLAARLLQELGCDAAAWLLPGIQAGTTVVAVCWAGADGRWSPGAAAVTATGATLRGQTRYVLDGDHADVLLVVATEGERTAVFAVDPAQPAVTRAHTPTMDTTRRLADVSFGDAQGARLSGDAAQALTRAVQAARVALSAEQVGAAERILELTVEYAKTREQFGRPIGSFQALKHRLADLYVRVEAARSASYAALDGVVEAGVAKVYCSEAFFAVAADAIQLHGGIAITWEHDAHLFFTRAQGSAQLFGTPGEQLAALAPLAGLA